jgi:hypothetical protein
MKRENMAPEIVQTQRKSCFRRSMVLQDQWILDEFAFNQEHCR